MKFIFLVLSILISSTSHASTVLVIGDSHTTGPFGKKLDEQLRANHTVMTRGVCGTIGQNWKNGTSTTCSKWNWGRNIDGKETTSRTTPKLDQLVDQMDPDFVILEFGGNYRSKLNNPKFITEDVAELIRIAKKNGAKCLFVTGPDTYVARDLLPETIDYVQKGVGQDCRFFNSLEVTQYPDEYVGKRSPDGRLITDGKHYSFLPVGEPLAHEWAEKVFATFTEMELNSLSSDLDRLNSRE